MLILSAFIANQVRILIPTAALTLSMIPFATVSIPISVVSLILPRKLVVYIDNLLYTAYMRTTLFVFENISAVKVIIKKKFFNLAKNKRYCFYLWYLKNLD